jgi:methyltransferase (TIGR00027 family)
MAEQAKLATASGPLIRDISDTALWVAIYRAGETDRPDALFRDPFARRLAGDRGRRIAASQPFNKLNTWSWAARTYSFDRFVSNQVAQGADMVLNLAAGLDTRPYRMSLPATLRWVEVDLPGILDYKERILAGEKPVCALERVRLDLSNVSARRDLFTELGRRAKRVLVLTEGLVIYLTREQVAALAVDLAAVPTFESWALDLASPGLVRAMQKQLGAALAQSGSVLQFGPEEGPGFFEPYGWKVVQVASMLKTAARLKRLNLIMRLLALLPESNERQGSRPWGAVCLLAKH